MAEQAENRARHQRPYHPQTQGKIERWHQTPERIAAGHYYLPADLERQVTAFRGSFTTMPAIPKAAGQSHAGRRPASDEPRHPRRERIKRQTIANRRLQHQLHAA